MSAPSNTVEFYKEKGKARYTLILDEQSRDKLAQVAKQHKISQGEVIEVLMDKLDEQVMSPHFAAKRDLKVSGRVTKGGLAKKLKGLSPDKLAAIEAIIANKQD